MNSQYPIPTSTFSFNPLNPNPNFSNPQFNFSSLPPPSQFHPQTQTQTPFSDLPTSLSYLKTLLQSSNSTLQSLSSFNFPSSNSNSLVQCPSNPNHWVPPSSLFRHSLDCPSPLDVGPLLDTLQYPKTLISNQCLIRCSKFVQPINDPTSELCFSIDDYVDFESNFFYQGCHGVVSSVNDDATKRIFTLPRVLSVECSNVVGNVDVETHAFPGNGVRMLPSEMWVFGKEIELWSDYPNEYSYTVLRALLCLGCLRESDLLNWLIANSPRFGVVIDVAVRDHMSVLFRMCLKAIVREGVHSYRTLFESNEGDSCRKLDHRSLRFKCPVMVEALRWLVSQLSILYGEMNAKAFVIALLGHLLHNAVSHALLIPLDSNLEQSFVIEPSKKVVENEDDDVTDARFFSRAIYVYQIAAAVAALHERSLLEERIRALRNPPPLTTYQRMLEHQSFSQKADEERQKRPDYRPLIEHDSLPSQQKNDQETTRLKTREELLAEERDYKRRRMSYRGKKHKRSAKEVMRDIIEDYMEAIKQTGGIGSLTSGDAGEMPTSKNTSTERSTNFETSHDLINAEQDGYRTLMDSGYKISNKNSDQSPRRKEQKKSESYYHRDHEDQPKNRDRYSRHYRSRSPTGDRRHSQSKEHKSRRRDEHSVEMDDREGSRCNYASSSQRSSSGRRDKRKKDRHRWNKYEDDERGSYERNEFSDRYCPEDDQFVDS